MNNAIYRQRVEAQQSKFDEERQWWDRKKATIQEGFMKELDAEGSSRPAAEQASATTPTTTSSSTPATKTPESSVAPSSVTGSDDDAVLVEADEQNGTPGTPGSKKKKKGKK